MWSFPIQILIRVPHPSGPILRVLVDSAASGCYFVIKWLGISLIAEFNDINRLTSVHAEFLVFFQVPKI